MQGCTNGIYVHLPGALLNQSLSYLRGFNSHSKFTFEPICLQALAFYKCKDLIVKNLKIQDAQQIHVSFQKCVNVLASNLSITAPEKSPNTDGIHVTNTQDILITTSIIATGRTYINTQKLVNIYN